MKLTFLPFFILLSSSVFVPINAESTCESYPRPGFDIKTDENGGEKFIATSEVTVPIDDRDLYLDSMEEAEIEAKLKIAKFLNEYTSGSTEIQEKSKRKVTVDGQTKSINSDIVRDKLKVLGSKTPETLMRGVRPLGSCYTPGQAVRVSVGWRLEDLDSAEKLSNTMSTINPSNLYNKKSSNYNKESSNSDKNSNTNFNPVKGYSDTTRLDDF